MANGKLGRPMHARHQDDIRAKIATAQLVLFVQKLATGKVRQRKGPATVPLELRLQAALALLRKTLPDLSSAEFTTDLNVTITHDDRRAIRGSLLALAANGEASEADRVTH